MFFLLSYNQEKIDTEGHLGVVYLEFIYKEDPECSITRQFLSGYKGPIISEDYTGYISTDNTKILVGQDQNSPYFNSSSPKK